MKNVISDKQSPHGQGAMLLRHGLLALGTGVLVALLEGGFPPTVFVQLFETWVHRPALIVQHGSQAIIWILVFLVVQSLFLIAIWSLLLWLVVGEYIFFVRIRARPTSMSVSPAPAKVRKRRKGKGRTASALPGTANPPVPSPAPSLVASANKMIARILLRAPTKRVGVDEQKGHEGTSQDEARQDAVKEKARKPYQNPFAAEVLANPFEGAGLITSTGRRRSTAALNMPAEDGREREENAAAESSSYVYGNPFTGPLPEVFEYDSDLKHSLAELAQERESQGEHAQSKHGQTGALRQENGQMDAGGTGNE